MTVWDWLPAFPWEGPPLPRFMGIPWPWLQETGERSSQFADFATTRLPELPISAPEPKPAVLYENVERLEIIRAEDGSIKEVIRHIQVTTDKETLG